MAAHAKHGSVRTRLTWVGGGDTGTDPEPPLGGAVVLVNAALASLAAGAAASSAHWPLPAALATGLLVGLVVGVVARAVAHGATRNRPALAGRAAVALVVGLIAGELAALAVFSGSIDRRIDDQAALAAQSVPAVAQASSDLDRARQARADLDTAVDRARIQRDQALVVARCEYNPSPECPQTHITGVPGTGPETTTANAILAEAQAELAGAVAVRDERAPDLDRALGDAERSLEQQRTAAIADPDRGLGARWVAMNGYTLGDTGALLPRLALTAFFGLLTLLPLILRLWRGETAQDRELAAHAERDRAGLAADTAIAVKQAEVRAETEKLWADQHLVNAQFAVEAQNLIDRERHRRRVEEAVIGGVATGTADAEQTYLPIAAEAEAASRTGVLAPQIQPAADAPTDRGSLIPALPEVTRAAARWIGPLVPQVSVPKVSVPKISVPRIPVPTIPVPQFLSRAIDTTRQPLRIARQAFEEMEEITFTVRRVHRVVVHDEKTADPAPDLPQVPVGAAGVTPEWTPSYRPAPSGAAAEMGIAAGAPVGLRAAEPRHLGESDGPRQLPAGE